MATSLSRKILQLWRLCVTLLYGFKWFGHPCQCCCAIVAYNRTAATLIVARPGSRGSGWSSATATYRHGWFMNREVAATHSNSSPQAPNAADPNSLRSVVYAPECNSGSTSHLCTRRV
eukprot:355914-Amphidinium_carterae.1